MKKARQTHYCKPMAILLAMAVLSLFPVIQLITSYRLLVIKGEMRSLVFSAQAEDQLVRMEFRSSEREELNWHKAWEFEYQGKMYDVARQTETEDGGLVVWCIEDKRENEIKQLVRNLTREAGKPEGALRILAKRWLNYIPETPLNVIAATAEWIPVCNDDYILVSGSDCSGEVEHPPSA